MGNDKDENKIPEAKIFKIRKREDSWNKAVRYPQPSPKPEFITRAEFYEKAGRAVEAIDEAFKRIETIERTLRTLIQSLKKHFGESSPPTSSEASASFSSAHQNDEPRKEK